MLDVRALPRGGPVAQRLEQGTHNPVFAPRNTFAPSNDCEHARPKKNKKEHHTVNIASTAARARGCVAFPTKLSMRDLRDYQRPPVTMYPAALNSSANSGPI